MKVYRLSAYEGEGGLVVPDDGLDVLLAELQTAEVGESFTVTIEEMSQERLDSLPEWDGF